MCAQPAAYVLPDKLKLLDTLKQKLVQQLYGAPPPPTAISGAPVVRFPGLKPNLHHAIPLRDVHASGVESASICLSCHTVLGALMHAHVHGCRLFTIWIVWWMPEESSEIPQVVAAPAAAPAVPVSALLLPKLAIPVLPKPVDVSLPTVPAVPVYTFQLPDIKSEVQNALIKLGLLQVPAPPVGIPFPDTFHSIF